MASAKWGGKGRWRPAHLLRMFCMYRLKAQGGVPVVLEGVMV